MGHSGDAWEYPMWRILQDQEPEMRHVLVGNETRVFERSAWQPEGIVSNRARAGGTAQITMP